jgi:hypothetical protein
MCVLESGRHVENEGHSVNSQDAASEHGITQVAVDDTTPAGPDDPGRSRRRAGAALLKRAGRVDALPCGNSVTAPGGNPTGARRGTTGRNGTLGHLSEPTGGVPTAPEPAAPRGAQDRNRTSDTRIFWVA